MVVGKTRQKKLIRNQQTQGQGLLKYSYLCKVVKADLINSKQTFCDKGQYYPSACGLVTK